MGKNALIHIKICAHRSAQSYIVLYSFFSVQFYNLCPLLQAFKKIH